MTLNARDLLPPSLLRLRRRLLKSDVLYSNFEAARTRCGPGYDDADLARYTALKTLAFAHSLSEVDTQDGLGLLRPLLGLVAAACDGEVSVLDFGGGGGVHYFLARQLMPADTRLNWAVVETSAMGLAARHAGLESDELHFYASVGEAVQNSTGLPDVVFSSGTLQYLPEPIRAFDQLVKIGAPVLVLTRVGLSADSTVRVIVQTSQMAHNGPHLLQRETPTVNRKIRYPVTFVPINAIDNCTLGKYHCILRVVEETGHYMAGRTPINMYGRVFRKMPT